MADELKMKAKTSFTYKSNKKILQFKKKSVQF
jgi:hypothetical protein